MLSTLTKKRLQAILTSSLARDSVIYGIGGMITSIVPFLLLPIMTRSMTPADYGVVSIFTLTSSVLTTLTLLNLHAAISAEHFKVSTEQSKSFCSACANIILVTFATLALLLMAIGNRFAEAMNLPVALVPVVLFFVLCQALVHLRLSLLQIQALATRFVLLQITLGVLNSLGSIALVIFLQMGANGRIYGMTGAYAIVAVHSVWRMYSEGWIFRKHDSIRAYLFPALGFGLPLLPHSMAGLIRSVADRYFVNDILGTGQTGIYTVGAQIGSILAMGHSAFNQAWVPWLYKRLASGSQAERLRIVKVTYGYFALLLATALLVGLSAEFYVPLIASDKYREAAPVILWIALAGAFDGMYKMTGNYLFYAGKTRVLSTLTMASTALNLVATPWLVRTFGAIGAAYAMFIGSATYFVAVWITSMRLTPMPWTLTTPKDESR